MPPVSQKAVGLGQLIGPFSFFPRFFGHCIYFTGLIVGLPTPSLCTLFVSCFNEIYLAMKPYKEHYFSLLCHKTLLQELQLTNNSQFAK